MARAADPARRDDILQAARAVFDERGYNDARMAEIAERAGVASGTVYLYFKSKEELVSALCEDYLSRLTEVVMAAIAAPDIATAIADSVHTCLEFAQRERDMVRLLDLRASLGKRCEMLPADKRMLESMADAVRARVETGEARDFDPVVLAEIVSGLMEWVTKACLVWGNGDVSRYEDTLIRLLQSALIADKPNGPGFYVPLMW